MNLCLFHQLQYKMLRISQVRCFSDKGEIQSRSTLMSVDMRLAKYDTSDNLGETICFISANKTRSISLIVPAVDMGTVHH